ncbi:MAG: peptidylprolyl isomerase [Gammaproteobacteria bacterium]
MQNIIKTLICAVLAFALPAFAAEVEMQTSKGVLVIAVDEERAPETAANFLQYVRDGFFDGLIFHRVIPGFVVQGGGLSPDMRKRPTRDPISNEANNGWKNTKYTLSMARTQNPNSATSQFFINLADNASLDYAAGNPGYAVFGEVVSGQDVVDAIGGVETGVVRGRPDVPVTPVIIEKASVK